MVKIKKKDSCYHTLKSMWNRHLIYHWWKCKLGHTCWKTFWNYLLNLNICITLWLSTSTARYILKIVKYNLFIKKVFMRQTSLVVQWLRICLPIQGTQTWSPVQEDPTCFRATKLCVPQLPSPRPGVCAPQKEKPPYWEARLLQLESSACSLQPEKVLVQQQTQHSQK